MSEAYGGSRAVKLMELTYTNYEPVCHLCGMWISDDTRSVDHIIARSHGGTDDLENLRPAHKLCNSARGNRPIEEWRATNTNDVEWLIFLNP
jgi:5-methylcytosine-specific restriction endonuclease McrA